MEMAKPTEADKEQFKSLMAGLPGIDIKPMFGNLGAFVNGNMFAGLFGPTLGLRLADADRDELVEAPKPPKSPKVPKAPRSPKGP